MSKYTTGEIAKLCGVTVRTVQYYDQRGILVPGELSEGGRRLYNESNLRKMKIICFLRDTGFSINNIKELFLEKDQKNVIELLIEEQKALVRQELREGEKKLQMLDQIGHSLKEVEDFSVESIGDIAHIMQNKTRLKKVCAVMLATAIPVGILEWTSILLGFFKGIWWPFALYTLLAVPYTVWILRYYRKKVRYICPKCHTVFKADKKEFVFARHTPATRKLTCPVCGNKGFCVETCEKQQPKPD